MLEVSKAIQKREERSAMLNYLTTLRRIPDEIILEMATREFVMGSAPSCLCGWALLEDLAALQAKPLDELVDNRAGDDPSFTNHDLFYNSSNAGAMQRMIDAFGGTKREWDAVFLGVCRAPELRLIELAFTLRVEEAVNNA
jgi:hypothetical protein